MEQLILLVCFCNKFEIYVRQIKHLIGFRFGGPFSVTSANPNQSSFVDRCRNRNFDDVAIILKVKFLAVDMSCQKIQIEQLCFVTCCLFRMEGVKDGPAVNDCLQFRFLHLDFNLLFTFLFQFSIPNIFFCSCCLFCKSRPCFDVWVAGVQILNDGRMKEVKLKRLPPPRRSSPQTFFLLHLGPSSSPT